MLKTMDNKTEKYNYDNFLEVLRELQSSIDEAYPPEEVLSVYHSESSFYTNGEFSKSENFNYVKGGVDLKNSLKKDFESNEQLISYNFVITKDDNSIKIEANSVESHSISDDITLVIRHLR